MATARAAPVIALLPDRRLDELLEAATRHRLSPAAIALVGHLRTDQTQRVLATIDRLDGGQQQTLAAALGNDPALRAAAPLILRAQEHLQALIRD